MHYSLTHPFRLVRLVRFARPSLKMRNLVSLGTVNVYEDTLFAAESGNERRSQLLKTLNAITGFENVESLSTRHGDCVAANEVSERIERSLMKTSILAMKCATSILAMKCAKWIDSVIRLFFSFHIGVHLACFGSSLNNSLAQKMRLVKPATVSNFERLRTI